MRFKKSSGITPSEKLLADLCDRSFLGLWSYPNLFNDKGKGRSGSGKELCDLLVVYGDNLIIFSDKSCEYPNTGDSDLDWTRWYRNSIKEPARTIFGAERWIKKFPEQVYLDQSCSNPLPIRLPVVSSMQVHRVCVALGAHERLKAEKGVPSLAVCPGIEGDVERFAVGRIGPGSGWVHVLDEYSLRVLLSELSTVADFLAYLGKKEQLCESTTLVRAESELDLLGYYLWNNREFPIPGKQFKLDPDIWKKVGTNPQFLARKEEDKVSYFWDQLIEYLNGLYLSESLEFGNEMSVQDYERGVRIMAGEDRFHRRILSKAILERAEKAKGGYIGSILPSGQPEVGYVLLIGPGDRGEDHNEYRKFRAAQLHCRCHAAKIVNREFRFIVGLAFDAKGVKGSSEDMIFMDTSEWGADEFERAKKLQEELGYFIPGKRIESKLTESEYPEI